MSLPSGNQSRPAVSMTLRQALRQACRLRSHVLPLLPAGILVLGLAVVQADLVLGATSLTQRLVDAFMPGHEAPMSKAVPTAFIAGPLVEFFDGARSVPWLVAGTVLLLLAGEVLSFGVEQLRFRTSQRFRARLQASLLQAFLWDTGASRQQRHAAVAQATFSQDAGGLGMLLIFGLLAFLEQGLKLVVYAAGLCRLAENGWVLAATLLPAAFLLKSVIMRLFLRLEQRAMAGSDEAMMDGHRRTLDFFGLMARLAYLGGEASQVRAVLDGAARHAAANRRFQIVTSLHGSVANFLVMLALPLAAILLARMNVSPGVLVQSQALFGAILHAVGSVLSFPGQFVQFAPALQRVTDALMVPGPGPKPPALESLTGRGPLALRLEKVTFGYEESGPPLLDGISFEAPAGSLVCLVGWSGAGKSTVARLIMGERSPTAGRILLGGVDVTAWHLWWRRELVAFLPAEPGLMRDTLAANLRFGREGLSEEEIKAAARACELAEVLDGYGDRPLVSGEDQLSSGQQRRLGVARLLLGRQPVWILDEPLANLDPRKQAEVARAIEAAALGHTVVVITHDPQYFASSCNVFLHEGHIVASGSHEQLIHDCHLYRELFETRARRREEDAADPQALSGGE